MCPRNYYHGTYIAHMAHIIKARKKSDVEIALMRTKYKPHLFEIKPGLMLTLDTYNDLAEIFNEAMAKNKQTFVYKGHQFTVDYAAFCLNRFDTIDESFNEEMMAYHAKQVEDAKKKVKGD